jgi:alkanesulfonate monooxygenase SsuD/methylene tetrahydromethanopterin reductase-like flavin-dependent oxidoreductase (luciferase family)
MVGEEHALEAGFLRRPRDADELIGLRERHDLPELHAIPPRARRRAIIPRPALLPCAAMQVGINLPVMVPGLDRPRILDWSRRIDAGPFSSLAAGERITFPNPEILVTLSAAAAVTERVKIAATVLVLPLHATAVVAKQIATLDVLSAGRVVLGVGGGARREDYAAAERDFDIKKLTRLEAQVAALRRIWAGELCVPGALRPVEPLPVQGAQLPILAGSLSEKSIRRAARWADGLAGFSFGPSMAEIGGAFDAARKAWAEQARPAPHLATSFWYALGANARAQLDEYLHRYLNFMGEGVAKSLAPLVTITSATALRDALRALRDLGADETILVPTTREPDEVDRVAEIVAGL